MLKLAFHLHTHHETVVYQQLQEDMQHLQLNTFLSSFVNMNKPIQFLFFLFFSASGVPNSLKVFKFGIFIS